MSMSLTPCSDKVGTSGRKGLRARRGDADDASPCLSSSSGSPPAPRRRRTARGPRAGRPRGRRRPCTGCARPRCRRSSRTPGRRCATRCRCRTTRSSACRGWRGRRRSAPATFLNGCAALTTSTSGPFAPIEIGVKSRERVEGRGDQRVRVLRHRRRRRCRRSCGRRARRAAPPAPRAGCRAPGLFSTITGTPSASASFGVTARAWASTPMPGGKATIDADRLALDRELLGRGEPAGWRAPARRRWTR